MHCVLQMRNLSLICLTADTYDNAAMVGWNMDKCDDHMIKKILAE